MSRDSSRTPLHLPHPRVADLFEDFTRSHLTPEEIYVPPQHQPPNPEDEDDVVPDQHAAFGIQRATMKQKEPAWRDLGLEELLRKGPREGVSGSKGKEGAGTAVGLELRLKAGVLGRSGRGEGSGLPR
ncbi:Apc13p-domain-containing protein [Mytilinidion resinicola]|uniref:Apc13p-domain-containing protein n=1 Tax=Mytilinidion resinicola TaxID=574789 RepID=A0A6A6YMV2_9PEZI|nr:Apc13p-domain-containing protein [Mytilinidion resinicola]KAF2809197.1 Apc13p-domain-containing protein [Mytilinidion resinicola]